MFTTNRANLTNLAATSVAIPTYNVTIQNMLLYLAVKQNLAIENKLRVKVHSAEELKILILYICNNKVELLTSISQLVSVRYNRKYEIRLKKI
jgi:hypothetical protein